ncbi:MAG: hypothetical protein EOP24_40210, partial [Hyphomicrobiales bacterium]
RGSFGTEFARFDHARIAEAMGCDGIRVEDPGSLASAFARAIDSTRPVVIDVETSLVSTYHEVTFKER